MSTTTTISGTVESVRIQEDSGGAYLVVTHTDGSSVQHRFTGRGEVEARLREALPAYEEVLARDWRSALDAVEQINGLSGSLSALAAFLKLYERRIHRDGQDDLRRAKGSRGDATAAPDS